jgi:acyl carrier protein
MNDIKERIRQYILSAHLPGETAENLSDETPLQTSGILDSLATMNVITFVEKEFNVELDVYDTSIERFNTVEQIATVVVRKRNAAQPLTEGRST